MNDYSPKDSLDKALRYWWLIVLLTIWGGLVGWLYHQVRSPEYEAQAEFFVSIDFSQTGDLTQFEEDHAVSAINRMAYSDAVLERLIARASDQGISIELAELKWASTLERRQARWTLYLRDEDPQRAAALVNLWAEETLAGLQEAHTYALQAQALRSYLNLLNTCGQADNAQLPEACNSLNLSSVPQDVQAASQELESALAGSQGLFPALIFDLASQASVPTVPVQFGRNSLVLAGGLIGFLIGVIVVNTDLPVRLKEGLRRG